jgi:hypothetical protein|tara:strand:+ start:266 stop:775 length:510 start_codon:yes stop_codon:yes gene_type:complete
MAYSTVPKTKRDGVIQLRDGTGSPVTLDVAYEDGNFSFSQPQEFSELVIMDRGSFSAIRRQDEQAITGSFSFHFRQFADSGEAGSIRDFVNKSGFYSGNISTGTTGTPYVEHYCVDIRYTAEGTDFGDDADHVVTLSKCVVGSLDFAEGDPSAFTLNFTCYGGATVSGP